MILNRVSCIICQHKALQKKPIRSCPDSAAQLLPRSTPILIAFQKSMCRKTERSQLLLVIGRVITFISLTFSSVEHLLQILPAQDLNLGQGIQAFYFSSSSLIFTLNSLAEYKISYLTMLDLLGKRCFYCGTAYVYVPD